MPLRVGTSEPADLKFGAADVDAVYAGDELVWTRGTPVEPGSQTMNASGNFVVPEYNELIVELWGGGAPGGSVFGDALWNPGASNGGATQVAALGLTAGGGQRGAARTAGGAGGTASGGDVNTTGGAGGPGSTTTRVSGAGGNCPNGGAGGPSAVSGGGSVPGNAGAAPGGGGSGSSHFDTNVGHDDSGNGGGAGGYCRKTYTRANGPTPGASLAVTVGAGGVGAAVTNGQPGGNGASGRARFTWS